jgi:DNA polymerase III subunit beta
MKIECTTDKLIEAVGRSEKITGKNLTLPVLSCLLLEAKGKTLVIRATNLDLGIEISLPVKVAEEGTIAVPGTILNNFLSTIRGTNVTLEAVEGNLKVTTEHNTTVIKSLNHEDFPTIPTLTSEKTLSLSARDLIKGIKSVWYSSATSSMKPELSSIYIYSEDDTATFVATDSFRLAEKKVKMKNAKDIGSLLIPVKNVPDILRVLETCEGDVDVSFTKNQISFSFGGVYLTSRVVDGVFPDYRQIIPKAFTTHITMLKGDLVSGMRVATLFSDKFNKLSIKIDPSAKLFQLSTRNADVGENNTAIEAVIEGEPLEINFNYKYITDCFQSIEADSVNLEFNGLTRPLIVRGINDKSFMYLVMPINK